MKYIVVLLSVFGLFLGVAACQDYEQVVAKGNVKSETRELKTFDSLLVSGNYKLRITLSPQQSLKITAAENILPYIETDVKDGRLTIRNQKNVSLKADKPIEVAITCRELYTFKLSGSGDINIDKLNSKTFEAQISGAGTLNLNGAADNLFLKIAGNADINAKDLSVKDAEVRIGGNGKVMLSVSDSLLAHIAGNGRIEYFGDPKVKQNITGNGIITAVANEDK